MAISKQRKQELIDEYVELLGRTKGLVITEYRGMTMKQLSELRRKLRENNAGLVVTKNTLFKIALRQVGMSAPENLFTGPVAVALAYDDLSKTIKTVLEYTKDTELFVAKGGVVGTSAFAGKDLEAISNLPPINVLRAQLVGMVTMPLTQFLGLLEEPGRQVVAVIQAATDGVVNVLAAYTQKEAA
ncbi:MAG: 50S ribosomal protein L10 [Chloroflexi bacterium]|nr:50S ribosomal protein L10 [Chloroflexota bacterium]